MSKIVSEISRICSQTHRWACAPTNFRSQLPPWVYMEMEIAMARFGNNL